MKKSNVSLTENEIALCLQIGFDENIALIVKQISKGSEISQLVECLESDEDLVINGITIDVDEEDAYEVIDALWEALDDNGYIAFYCERNYGDEPDKIAVIKSDDQLDILRIMHPEGIDGVPTEEELIAKINEWQLKYPMRIIGADFNWVEIVLSSDIANIRELTEEIRDLWPDVVENTADDYDEFVRYVEESHIIFLAFAEFA
ncbi:MAG: DUF4253 domain-containing protein [Armatimonadota bacterium]